MAPQPASSDPPYSATHPEQENPPPASDHSGMSAGAIATLVVVLFFFFSAGGYILYTQLRARRLGLPTPNWRTYVPFLSNNRRYNNTRSRAVPALSSYEPHRNEWDHRIEDDDDGGGMRRGRSRSREPERDAGANRARGGIGMEADGFVGSGVRGGRMSVDSERRSAFRESIT